jgi:2-polyprenyl-6-methoxyphenol hydroxylase-like FAD-dependent oxidoreductase
MVLNRFCHRQTLLTCAPVRIAVVGCGIAGSGLAWRLASAGHHVEVFEKAPKLGAVGAGILLQPNGQAVLESFGVLGEIRAHSAKIGGLDAKHRSGKKLTKMDYETLLPGLHGLGVLRGHLFDILMREATAAGATVFEGHHVISYSQTPSEVSLQSVDGQRFGPFDAAIAADGSRSLMRAASGSELKVTDYQDGALWMAAPFSGDLSRLVQIVHTDGRLVGILPVGHGLCSFFWGAREEEWDQIRSGGLEDWKRRVAEFDPEAGRIAASVQSVDAITFATYRTSRMKSVVDGRVAFVGDAAHATAPHLGQGLNLALGDVASLARHLSRTPTVDAAFEAYRTERLSTTRYYSQLTGLITPFFQTSNRILQLGRDITLPWMPAVPYLNQHMLLTMSGLKPAWSRPIRPRRLAARNQLGTEGVVSV